MLCFYLNASGKTCESDAELRRETQLIVSTLEKRLAQYTDFETVEALGAAIKCYEHAAQLDERLGMRLEYNGQGAEYVY